MTQIKMYEVKVTKKPIPIRDSEVKSFLETKLFYCDREDFTFYKLTKGGFKSFRKEVTALAKVDNKITENRFKKLEATLNKIEKKLGSKDEIILTI